MYEAGLIKDDDDILVAGTAIRNSTDPATMMIGDYNGVTVVVYTDDKGNGTICPDYIQDSEEVKIIE